MALCDLQSRGYLSLGQACQQEAKRTFWCSNKKESQSIGGLPGLGQRAVLLTAAVHDLYSSNIFCFNYIQY